MEHWDRGSKKISKFENARVKQQITKFYGSHIICGLRIGPFFAFISTNAECMGFVFWEGLAAPIKAAAQGSRLSHHF